MVDPALDQGHGSNEAREMRRKAGYGRRLDALTMVENAP